MAKKRATSILAWRLSPRSIPVKSSGQSYDGIDTKEN